MPASGRGATSSNPTPRSTWCISPSCARRRSRTARRSSELSLIAFPIRELFEVKLDEFDLIIFDRYQRRGVLPAAYLDNIVRYVENGGALLEAAGPSFGTPMSLSRTPLGAILPAEPTGKV